jgi:hypothetical protein
MKLADLEPRFIRITDPGWSQEVDTIQEAQGVIFLCPACWLESRKDPVQQKLAIMVNHGVHSIKCWSSSRGVPDDALPGPGRWTLEGTGLDDLTLGCEPGKSRSILLQTAPCHAHFFVTNGDVQMA